VLPLSFGTEGSLATPSSLRLGLVSNVQLVEKPTKVVVDNSHARPQRREDYRNLDKPTSIRRQAASRPEPQGQAVYARAVGSDTDLEFLDIPAFLRKQAD
jgi:cell division protein FtsZ